MFIQTESTPNPDSLKFLPGKEVMPSGSRDFRSFREAQVSPLAKKIFQMEGVTGVFLASDFVTVSKNEEADWLTLKPQVFASIMDFYAEGEGVLGDGGAEEADSLVILDDDSEVVQMIKELLDMRIRPSVQVPRRSPRQLMPPTFQHTCLPALPSEPIPTAWVVPTGGWGRHQVPWV